MRKPLLLTSFLVMFIMLMIPTINAYPHQDVLLSDQKTNDITYEYLKQAFAQNLQTSSPNKARVHLIQDHITIESEPCITCIKNDDSTPCFDLFIEYTTILSIASFFLLTIILIPIALILYQEANRIYNLADSLGCLWTGG